MDITADIGPLFPSKDFKYPMYSYERPAYHFWQGVYNGMIKLGKTHDEAMAILQSKAARWLLDLQSDTIQHLGEAYAEKIISLY